MIEIVLIVVPASTVIISVIALYFALKRTNYNEESLKIQREALKVQKKMYRDSKEYWGSWDKRAKDVSRRVIEQMTEEELEIELNKKRLERKRRNNKNH